jgi:uncharacterized Fe-S cluster-containing radical SAM superfamily protein
VLSPLPVLLGLGQGRETWPILQLAALENLVRFNVSAHPAVMVSFSTPENIKAFNKRLSQIHENFEDFELEELVLYPTVEERLLKADLS